MVDEAEYFEAIRSLIKKLKDKEFDCIVAIKRSGWIGGVFLSNQLNLPLFTCSEIPSIPAKFNKVLLFDDKCCTGKSMHKIFNQLLDRQVTTSCLFKQGHYRPALIISDKDKIVKMFYEKKIQNV